MKSNLTFTACLGATLSMAVAFSPAQDPTQTATPSGDAQADASSSPAAYVYVSSIPKNSNVREIVGYVAGSNGSLKPIAGSPFAENVYGMAVNGKYMMAINNSTPDIDTFAIEPDGALRYTSSLDYVQYIGRGSGGEVGCGGAGQLFFDHTGATLYASETACDENHFYGFFGWGKATGKLTYLGEVSGNPARATFLGNDVFAYSALNDNCMYYNLSGYKRASNGSLASNGTVVKNLPTPPAGVKGFVATFVTADSANHLAVAMQPANPPGCASGPMQLATYTADASGDISTTSTASNMPDSAVFSIFDMRMSPSGKVLAVGGHEGLQLFHFNGVSPITHYTGLITSDPIDQTYWDNSNHLYAISQGSGKLFVYTVTATGYKAAPGSPYTVSDPQSLMVQPLPIK
jgi:hypothetical protein